jgi:hypothetical protein
VKLEAMATSLQTMSTAMEAITKFVETMASGYRNNYKVE